MGTVKTDSFGRQYYEANFDEYMDRNGNFHRGVTVFVEAEQTDEENPRPLGLGAYIVEPARDPSKKDYPGRIVEINDDADPNVDPTKTDRITVNVQPHAGDGGLDTVYTTSPDLGLYADKWPWNWEGAWPWKW
jgi:hypothetical protein